MCIRDRATRWPRRAWRVRGFGEVGEMAWRWSLNRERGRRLWMRCGARPNGRALGVDGLEENRFPVGISLRAHDHDDRLRNVQPFLEQQKRALLFARLQSLGSESRRQRNHVERAVLAAARRHREIGWNE